MATTKPLVFPMPDHYVTTDVTAALLAGTIIPFGTPAVLDHADGKVKPVTQTLIRAGAAFLGIALATYDNTDGSFTTTGPRMLFARDCQWICPTVDSGGAPVTLVGDIACLTSNSTCTTATIGTDLVTFRCDAFYPDGSVLLFVF